MRNFLAFVLALTLVFWGKMLLNPVSKGIAASSDEGIGKAAELTYVNSTDSNAVEKDGIRFEILMPERVLTIPTNQPEDRIRIKLGIRIINQKPNPIRINWINSVFPELVGADGTALKMLGGKNVFIAETKQSSCPLVRSGEGVTLFMENMLLYWENDLLKFGSGTGYSGAWYFEGLKPGTYYVRLSYANLNTTNLCIDPANPKVKAVTVKEFWTGFVVTPFVKFRLERA